MNHKFIVEKIFSTFISLKTKDRYLIDVLEFTVDLDFHDDTIYREEYELPTSLPISQINDK